MFGGIDYDTNSIHIVLLPEESDRATFQKIVLPGPGDAFDRARHVRDRMPARGSWKDEGVLAIGIEEPWTRQLNSLVGQIRVQGAILACLPADVVVLPFPPNRKAPDGWKAITVGRTDATKADIAGWALERLAAAYEATADLRWPQHAYDAFAIAWATRSRWQWVQRKRAA